MAGKMKFCGKDCSGSILILTVWTLFFLAALAVAVGSYVSSGLVLARQAAADAYGRTAALAGVEHACAVLDADTNRWDGFSENWGYSGDIDWDEQRLGDAVYSVYHVDSQGVTNAGMVDEESRINLNKATEKQLEAAFRIIGRADAIEASSLAAAVIDWRDEDDEVSEGGVEGGFYAGLQPGYKCANEEFRSVYELLLLRGMTDEIFERMYSVVTVYGNGKINLNTAESSVLQVIAEAAGADESTAQGLASKIEGFRKSGGQFSEASSMGIASAVKDSGVIGAEEEAILLRMMMYFTLKGSCFRAIAGGGRITHSGITEIEFIYSKENRVILFWNEL